MHVIIRDDDVSYFTRFKTLQTLYGLCWDLDIPICLSVVPLASPTGGGVWPPAPRPFAIAENRELCAFLNEALREGKVEICLHGYAHVFGEYAIEDRAIIARLFEDGLNVLRAAFPEAEIHTFVPPHECFSLRARDFLIKQGFNICTTSVNLFPPTKLGWLAFRLKRWLRRPGFQAVVRQGDVKLFICDEQLFNADRRPEDCYRRAWGAVDFCSRKGFPLICVNHHWHFFDERGQPRRALLDRWSSLIEELAAEEEVFFTTFNRYR